MMARLLPDMGITVGAMGPRALFLDLVGSDPQPDDATLRALSAAAQHTLDVAAFIGNDRCEFMAWEFSAMRVDQLDEIGPRRIALAVRYRHRLVAASLITMPVAASTHAD